MPMGTELLKYCNNFFHDFDFLLMLFHYCIIMIFIVILMKLFVPAQFTQTNLTFYMTGLTLMLVLANLRIGTFPAGCTRLTDEAKVQILFAFKSFITVWCVLVYSEGVVEQFFGMDIEGHHNLLVKRLNQVMALGGNKVNIMVEFTYMIYALAAAIIGFLIVKPNISFAFYFFVMTRTASKDGTNRYLETQSEGKRFTFGQVIKLLYVNLLAPLFVSLLFMHELTGSFFTQTLGLGEYSWQMIRIMVIMCVVAVRFLTYREELQFQFDQSYYIISRMIQNEVEKTENTFLYVK